MAAAYAIKAAFENPDAASFRFRAHKTMYGGRAIRPGDIVYLFASERSGGRGLFARGVVTAADTVAPIPGVARQTPRVDVVVHRTETTDRSAGRAELARFTDWDDGRPETELNFKLYRQATDKIVGVTPATAAYLDSFFK